MKNIFINPVEHRLRAGFRLICFFLLAGIVFLAMAALAAIVFGMVSSGANGRGLADFIESPLVSSIITLLAVVSSYLVCSLWIDRRKLVDIGFRFNALWWRDFIFGLFLGAILLGLVFAVELALGWVTITGVFQSKVINQSFLNGVLQFGVLFFCVGIYEELVSRGYLMRNLAEGFRGRFLTPASALIAAYILSSLVFSLLHLANPNSSAFSAFCLVIAGLQLGLGYLLTGSLAIPIGLHMTWNFFEGVVFGFPVSGVPVSASVFAIQQSGPEIFTGGAFGQVHLI